MDKADLNYMEASKFIGQGDGVTAVRTSDMSIGSSALSVTGETISFAAGAAGTTGVVGTAKCPITDVSSSELGSKGNTSFAWVTGTILTAEVLFDPLKTQASILAGLSNGQYAINYDTGKIYYKKATTGTSDTCNYKTLQVNSAPSISGYAEDSAHVSGDLGTQILTKRTDTAASSAGTDGDYATLNTDSTGHVWSREGFSPVAEDNTNGVIATQVKPIAVANYSYSEFQNLGANATLNVKATAGNVFAVKCLNVGAASNYLQLHNTATVPAANAVPVETFLLKAGEERVIGTEYFGPAGRNFATGIAFAFSSAPEKYTAGTAAEQYTFVKYI